MQNVFDYLVEDALTFKHPDASPPIQPDSEPHSGDIRIGTTISRRLSRAVKAAIAHFGHVTIFSRVALISFVSVMAGVALVVAAARTQAILRTFELPAAIFQNNVPSSLAVCENLHNESFRCKLDIDGEAVIALYDGMSRTQSYSSKSIRELSLGDLIVAWGTPDGISHYYQETIVIWGPRTAYFGVCALHANSRVNYLGYGFAEHPTVPWRGFVSYIPDCAYGQ